MGAAGERVMTAPTEEEIRATFARAWSASPPNGHSIEIDWEDAWSHIKALVDEPWDLLELRQSELDRLDELQQDCLDEIKAAADRQVIDRLVEVALRFAREYPDAPRRREPIPA